MTLPAVNQAFVRLARTDPAAFASLCMRDEQTGSPVTLTRAHREMQKFWQTHERTVSWAPPELGKSANLASYVAWSIGCDPSLRVGYLSATLAQAQRHLRAVAIVMSSPAYAQVFPATRIANSNVNEVWTTNRPATAKDAPLVAGAFDLSSMLGARLDLIACDDVVTVEQRHSQATRDRAFQDFLAVTSSRLAPGGRIHVVGTAEHPDDLPHRLAKLPGYVTRKFPVLDSSGQSTFPARWPLERIEQRRQELGPVKFLATMLCEATSEAALCFREDDLVRAVTNGLASQHSELPAGCRCVLGVDPAWTSRPDSDESGIVMVAVDPQGYRHLTLTEGVRLPYEQLANRVVALAKINRATAYIESNGAGVMICDAIAKRAPAKPLSTSRQSKESRVEALSAELASGRWIFRQPLGAPSDDLRKLIADMHVFSFDRHCGDRLAALLIAVEGVRSLENRPRGRVFESPITLTR